MLILRTLLALLRALLRNRSQLALENLALRHQLLVLRRSVQQPQLHQGDRLFWVFLSRVLKNWRPSLVLVKPDTVVAWHRKGLKLFWKWKSRTRRRGRPMIPRRIINLIRRLARENPLWTPERIQSELTLLGHDVAEATVKKYMGRSQTGSPGWITFLRNHLPDTVACDFFSVLWLANYNFCLKTSDSAGMLRSRSPPIPPTGTLSRDIRASDGGVISNSLGTGQRPGSKKGS